MLEFRTAAAGFPAGMRQPAGSAHGRVAVETPRLTRSCYDRFEVCLFRFGRKSTGTLTVSEATSRRWLFGEPDFRRLWLIGLVVFSVRWLEMLAVAVFAYQRTGSPFVVAL